LLSKGILRVQDIKITPHKLFTYKGLSWLRGQDLNL
jgi:hypothetical protein